MAAIGIAVFICEGAILDRKLDYEGAAEIYEIAEQYDYQDAGMTLEDGKALAKLITTKF